MKRRYVVDTNVLIAASAADPKHPKDIDATPADPLLRKVVWNWLDTFSMASSHMILDHAGGIYDEYNNKLGFNDFGLQVVMTKWSKNEVDTVDVVYDEHGHGVLPDTLSSIVHDDQDKKMVAAALATHHRYGEGCIAFAGDTDWHDWEGDLRAHDILLEPIIEEWSRAKHAEKKAR